MSVNVSATLSELFTEIAGERTVLRMFQPADITADYVGWLNDPFVTHFSNQTVKRDSDLGHCCFDGGKHINAPYPHLLIVILIVINQEG